MILLFKFIKYFYRRQILQKNHKMKDTTLKLTNLRNLLKKLPNGGCVNAYIIPSDDAHQSEYICKHDERREYISNFDGSAGTAVVTMDKALLWTDGRYYLQADKQLDENWTLMKDGLPNTLSIGNWLLRNLPKQSKIGVDPKLMSFRCYDKIQKELQTDDYQLIPIEQNLVDLIWEDQPELTKNAVKILDLDFAGETIREKWTKVLKEMSDKKSIALVVSALDEIAWFLNLRGNDIEYNPVFFSYLIITENEIILFIDSEKLPQNFSQHNKTNGVSISVFPYDAISSKINEIVSGDNENKIWISPTSSFYLSSLVPKRKLFQDITPIAIMKAIKNPTELAGFLKCHIRDGAALCQYFAWLENEIKNGNYVDEMSGASKLEEFRSKKEYFMGLSFSTISGSGPNSAIIHYHPKKETNRQITDSEVYLCDSGAQYLDGTTDITRTFHFGQPTDFQKETYTRVLKGQLTLASTVFPKKVKGQVLDTLARKALWDIGLDYGHGTGHGVGHFLNVHEGPMGVGIRLMPDDPGLQENMIISNEPGYYQDKEFGIRIEDLVQIITANNVKYDFSGRGALTFKTISMCPIQQKLIIKDLLTEKELNMLNNYHKTVLNELKPIFEREKDILTLNWLEKETQPL